MTASSQPTPAGTRHGYPAVAVPRDPTLPKETGMDINGPWMGFDLETTGVDPEVDRVVTAAVVTYAGGRATQVRAWVSDADGVEIPAAATAVHGYTTEMAREAGRPAGEVIAEVTAALVEACNSGMPLVVMIAPYDLTMIQREAVRHGLRGLFDAAAPYVLDPAVLDRHVDPYRPGRRRLVELCDHWAVTHGGAHDAVADAVAACRVTAAVAARHPWLTDLPLDELHVRQARWHADYTAGLRDYYARKPGWRHLAEQVRMGWPIVPAPAQVAVRGRSW